MPVAKFLSYPNTVWNACRSQCCVFSRTVTIFTQRAWIFNSSWCWWSWACWRTQNAMYDTEAGSAHSVVARTAGAVVKRGFSLAGPVANFTVSPGTKVLVRWWEKQQEMPGIHFSLESRQGDRLQLVRIWSTGTLKPRRKLRLQWLAMYADAVHPCTYYHCLAIVTATKTSFQDYNVNATYTIWKREASQNM